LSGSDPPHDDVESAQGDERHVKPDDAIRGPWPGVPVQVVATKGHDANSEHVQKHGISPQDEGCGVFNYNI
jgi:hypothetical protein